MIGLLLVVSVAAQVAAAMLALRLTRVTGRRRAWIPLSLALALMAGRRIISVVQLASGVNVERLTLLSEGLGLVVSVAMLVGVSWIGWVFRKGQADAGEAQRLAGELSLREDRQRRIMEALPVAVVVLAEGEVRFANATAEALLGEEWARSRAGVLCQVEASSRREVAGWLEGVAGSSQSPKELFSVALVARGTAVPRRVVLRGEPIEWDGVSALLLTLTDTTEADSARRQGEENEALFHAVAGNETMAVFIYQGDRFLFVNSGAEGITGYGREELIGKEFWSIVHPDHQEQVRRRGIARQQGEQAPRRYQFKIVRKDGEARWVDFSAAQVSIQGQPAAVGTALDISAHKKLEEELRAYGGTLEAEVAERTRRLRETEESFRALAENSVDVIMRFDRSHRHLYVNPVVEQQTGIPVLEFIGRTHEELGFSRELVNLWEEAIERVFVSGEPHRVEFQLPNGIWIDWLLAPERDGDGAVRSVLTTAREVTDRKRAEGELARHRDRLEELVAERTADLERANALLHREIADRRRAEAEVRASEERFRSLYTNVSIGMYRTTPDGRVLMANPALVRMVGLPSFEALAGVNLEVSSVYADMDRAAFRELVERVGEIHGLETRWRRADGSVLMVRESSRVVRDTDGHVLYYEGTVEDITSLHALHEQLRQVQRIESLGQLAGGIAHDFNNLLMAIRGSAELLEQRLDGIEPREELETIQQSVVRGADLTRSLLAFARRRALKRVTTDVNAAVESFLPVLRRVIPENIAIVFHPGKGLPAVEADRSGLDQVLMNLCVNARDAMPEGGVLTIETALGTVSQSAAAGRVALFPGRFVCLMVSDNGVGIPELDRPRLFEPFFTTKAPGQGTGLGLASVYGIVSQHGGHCHVYSEMGRGSTFKIYLPVSRGEVLPETSPFRDEVRVAGGDETILVTEDEPEVRQVLVAALRTLGYRVLEAGDGEEALAIIRGGEQVDLVVSDMVMPRMGGRDLYRETRALTRPPRFVFSSGYTEAVLAQDLEAARETAFLSKPYGIEELARTVRMVLDQPGGD